MRCKNIADLWIRRLALCKEHVEELDMKKERRCTRAYVSRVLKCTEEFLIKEGVPEFWIRIIMKRMVTRDRIYIFGE
jgi:hypothetical protein